jgi:hypothetical protein
MHSAVFIASSYDEDNRLNQVFSESNGIANTINRLRNWKCQHIHKASLDDVFNFFSKNNDSWYQVFHFAGHAVDRALQFNESVPLLERARISMPYIADVGGLATIISARRSVQLVFLNGCSTAGQVSAFKNAGIPAIIYTNQALNDELGMAFAKSFYLSFFEHGNSLGVAFQFAIGAIESLKTKHGDKWLDTTVLANMKRGIENLDALPGTGLYELEASEDFKSKTWQQWPKPDMPAPPSPTIDPRDLQRLEIPDSTIHRCDRSDELDEYHEFLEALATKKLGGPLFFFIHEKSPACPQSLVKRFELFGVSELCDSNEKITPSTFVWKELNLPKKKELRQPGTCKSRLLEIYDSTLFKCPLDAARNDFVFEPNTYGDKVFVIHHDLTKLELESAADLQHLLDFYLGEFCTKVNSELKARLAVVFSYLYFGDQPEFAQMFGDLAGDARFVSRVKNITGMRPVALQHVGTWREKVFKDRNFPIPPKETDLFPFGESEHRPMRDVQEQLVLQLVAYNQKIRTQHE